MRFNLLSIKQAQLVLLITILFTSGNLFADVMGKIVDENGQPIIGATIATNLDGVGTLSGKDGKFSIDRDDLLSITVSSIGYKPQMLSSSNLPEKIVLKRMYYKSDDIIVTSDRAEVGITPIAFDNISKKDIERDYTVGEFPLLLKSTPNLHSYSDGGAALGYSYTKIRGFDDKRIVTYINGVPLNDPEDHATYFVDLPDFPANVSDIQIQRGVGNSLYGDASFGGSINIVTSTFDSPRMTTLTSGYGEYTSGGKSIAGIYKQSLAYSSGLINGKYAFNGRFSKQKTGGYKHNSWYEGWAYYFSVGRIDKNMTTELYVYGGPMIMHLAYWGTPRYEIEIDRRYNPLTYSNETDNFNQPHYHLHNSYRINDKTTLTNTLYYIRGKGYYEQFKDERSFDDYNIDPGQIDLDPNSGQPYQEGDLVRQQWVHKSQYGWNSKLDIKHDKGSHTFGSSLSLFESNHWGEVVWAEHLFGLPDPHVKYYQYFGDKIIATMFAQEYYNINDKFSTQITAQFRYQNYKLDSKAIGAFVGYDYDTDWLFFSPRLGLNYSLTEQTSLYTNFAIASRTPSDVAIYDANDPDVVPSLDANGDPTAKSERVYDYEFGLNYRKKNIEASLSLFYMVFQDEIIPYGGINESGIAYTINAKKSIHSGIELSGAFAVNEYLNLSGNFSYNHNRVKEVDNSDDFLKLFNDKTTPYFPAYLANFILDLKPTKNLQVNYNHKFVGQQFMELYNLDEHAINAVDYGSIAFVYSFDNLISSSKATVQFRVDNLYDRKYENSGYGGNWMGATDVEGWAEYYVASERSFYGQLKLDLF